MSKRVFALIFPFVFIAVAGIGLVLLVRPSLHFRLRPNPFMPDTPWNRLQMRVLGLFVFLFITVPFGWWLSDVVKSPIVDGFSSNILVALWVVFVAAIASGIVSWILWRFSAFRSFIRHHYPNEKLENREWDRRVTLIFCSILVLIVGVSDALAAEGSHP
jgi:hypothetical protein